MSLKKPLLALLTLSLPPPPISTTSPPILILLPFPLISLHPVLLSTSNCRLTPNRAFPPIRCLVPKP